MLAASWGIERISADAGLPHVFTDVSLGALERAVLLERVGQNRPSLYVIVDLQLTLRPVSFSLRRF
jgi:hypothetical protein